MTYEEKLDFILKRLYDEGAFYVVEAIVCDYLQPHVSQIEFQEFMHKLIGDGYLQQHIDINSLGPYQQSFTSKSYKYSITSKGRHFVESGDSYSLKSREEKYLKTITKKSYKINVWILILSVVSLILALIALIK